MKFYLPVFGLLIFLLLTGCATQSRVANMQGQGKKTVFDAPYDAVWRAAIDAAQAGDLDVRATDKQRGYIGATRGMRMETMGENVGVWLTSVTPNRTQVEVVSRQAGLPMLWFKNWENQILNGIAANLTRDPSYGTASQHDIREPAGSPATPVYEP